MYKKHYVSLETKYCHCFDLTYNKFMFFKYIINSLCDLKKQILKILPELKKTQDLKTNDILIFTINFEEYQTLFFRDVTYSFFYRKQKNLELNITNISEKSNVDKYITFLTDEYINLDVTLTNHLDNKESFKYYNPVMYYNMKKFDTSIYCLKKSIPELKNFKLIIIPE